MGGKDHFNVHQGFPVALNFGPGEDELTLSSWTGLRTLNLRSGEITPFNLPTVRDQSVRKVLSPGSPIERLVATPLYARVEIARANVVAGGSSVATAEPIVVRGSYVMPQFSRSGKRILTLSGGTSTALDTLRVSDVTMLNEPNSSSSQKLETARPPE